MDAPEVAMTYLLAWLSVFCLVATARAENLGVQDVLARIKSEIAGAQQEQTGQPRLLIEKVELDLFLEAQAQGEGGISLSVPFVEIIEGKLLGEMAQSTSQRLTLTLKPDPDTFVATGTDLGLASAIKEVKRALQDSINTPPALTLDQFVFEVKFQIVTTAAGGINFWIVEAGAQFGQEHANRATVYMKVAEE